MKRLKIIVGIIMVILIAVYGCASKKEAPQQSPTPVQQEQKAPAQAEPSQPDDVDLSTASDDFSTIDQVLG